jgi:predicted nucleotidyltransferase
MATKVYDTVTVELQNGDTIEVKPLPIKRLRRFMEVIAQMDDESSDKSPIDVMVEAAAIVLEKKYPHLANDQDELEELLDVPTMVKIVEVAGGLNLSGDNPNLVSPPGTI